MTTTAGPVDKIVVDFVKKYKYPPGDTSDDLLVLTMPTDANESGEVVKFLSGVLNFLELQGTWDATTKTLSEASLYLQVPGFDRVVLFSQQKFSVPTSDIQVAIPGSAVSGTASFSIKDENPSEVFNMKWDIYLPWLGLTVSGNRDLFRRLSGASLKVFGTEELKDIGKITDSEVSALRQAPLSSFKTLIDGSGKELIQFFDSDEVMDEKNTAKSFIHDNVGAGNYVVALPAGRQGLAEAQVIDVNFLIFQLTGSVTSSTLSVSAILYAKIPFIGRVKIAELVGSLVTGVTFKVDLLLVKGSVKIYVKQDASGRNTIYVDLDLDIPLINHFKLEAIKILTL